jgi:DNA-directed RNA polymerase subunit RPC12/RpoP
MRREQYKDFDATELFCLACGKAVPVRKRLLLVLPGGDKYDYTCVYCGASVGEKTVTDQDNNLRVIIK